MNVLMLSSSKFSHYNYLAYAKEWIDKHIKGCDKIVFIPYAGVSINWSAYTQKVRQALPEYNVLGLHESDNAKSTINSADAILVGGGNTFNLLYHLQKGHLLNAIRDKVEQGAPYIGWSAGANICGNSIRTTNDMPIIEPISFDAFKFLEAQINPHYTDISTANHHGETRDQRLTEFCTLHPSTPVIAIREGSALILQNNELRLLGDLTGYVFIANQKREISKQSDLAEYL